LEKKMKPFSKQSGMSLYTLSIVICIVVFLALIFAKIMPIYYDQYTLKSIITSVSENSQTEKLSKNEFRTAVQKRFQINNVKFDIKNLKFEGDKIVVKYETRVNIVSNVDAIVSFDNEYPWNKK
jgi:hypothetical protein